MPLFLACSLLLALAAARAQEAPPDTAAGGQRAARPDSARRPPIDPAYAWKTWADLSRAIALRPLDGPEDIIEKAEIIADRTDDLREEEQKLKTALEERQARQQALELQLEVLEELAQVQRGGDLQLQQRQHDLREEAGRAARRLRIFRASRAELAGELERLAKLAEEYREKAEALRRREEESR
jgi:hypothetical protein